MAGLCGHLCSSPLLAADADRPQQRQGSACRLALEISGHGVKDGNPKIGPTRANESTPLMVGGTLYTRTSLSQVAAIDAATGGTKWVFDPKVYENGLGIPAN